MSRSIETTPKQLFKLFRGKSGRIGVTGFSSQYCEIKAVRDRQKPPELNEAMRVGSEIHLALEENLMGPPVTFTEEDEKQFTLEDWHAAKLGDATNRWSHLARQDIAREVPVYGRIGDIDLKGIIDEIQVLPDTKELLLIDTKTHRSETLPEYKQRLAYHQLLVYHELMTQMIRGKTDLDQLVRENTEDYNFDKELHPAVVNMFGSTTLNAMLARFSESVTCFKDRKLADRVRVDFIDRKTHAEQRIEFRHDAETAAHLFAFRGELFSGHRRPLPLSRENGTCRYCPHFAICQERQS